ncbi:auxin-responsive protein IAA27 [Capsicum chacoense]
MDLSINCRSEADGEKQNLLFSPKRSVEEKKSVNASHTSKTQVVGWPPVRSFRKNTLATKKNEAEGKTGSSNCLYVKVSMDGAPYLRKVDIKTYSNYADLSSALEKMFSCFSIGQCASDGLPGQEELTETHLMDLLNGSEYVLTYEDKDGDWMLVGDVPWEMFIDSCKRLRIMKSSEAIGLAPRAINKSKNQN